MRSLLHCYEATQCTLWKIRDASVGNCYSAFGMWYICTRSRLWWWGVEEKCWEGRRCSPTNWRHKEGEGRRDRLLIGRSCCLDSLRVGLFPLWFSSNLWGPCLDSILTKNPDFKDNQMDWEPRSTTYYVTETIHHVVLCLVLLFYKMRKIVISPA